MICSMNYATAGELVNANDEGKKTTIFITIFVSKPPPVAYISKGMHLRHHSKGTVRGKGWNFLKADFFWSVKCGWVLLKNRWNISNAA